MIVVTATPPGGPFIEFVRVNIVASDDGNSPITTGPYEVVFTTDGTIPVFSALTAPLTATATTLLLVSTEGFPPVGTVKVGTEVIAYSGVTPATLTGLTRGAQMTAPATHTLGARVIPSGVSVRRSPVKNLPIDGPRTVKFYARTLSGSNVTAVASVFFDVAEVTAKNEIKTADPTVRNYTLKVDNGDIIRDDKGLYDIVSGDRKTAQDVKEVILVENVGQGQPVGNRTLPQFGSALSRLIGQTLPAGFAKGQIQTTLFQAITFLQSLQREENVPANEQIRRIINISVDSIDPTSYRYQLQVETVGGDKVTIPGVIGG